MKNIPNKFRYNGRNKFEICINYEGTELFEDNYMKNCLKSALKAIESVYDRFLKKFLNYKQFQNLKIEVMEMYYYGQCYKLENKLIINSMCYKDLESTLFHELLHYMLGYVFWRPYDSYINIIEEGFVRRVEDLFYPESREENTRNFLFDSTNDYFGYLIADILLNEKLKWQETNLLYPTSEESVEKQESFYNAFAEHVNYEVEKFFVNNMDYIILNTLPNEFGTNLPDGLGFMYREYLYLPLTFYFNSLKPKIPFFL